MFIISSIPAHIIPTLLCNKKLELSEFRIRIIKSTIATLVDWVLDRGSGVSVILERI